MQHKITLNITTVWMTEGFDKGVKSWPHTFVFHASHINTSSWHNSHKTSTLLLNKILITETAYLKTWRSRHNFTFQRLKHWWSSNVTRQKIKQKRTFQTQAKQTRHNTKRVYMYNYRKNIYLLSSKQNTKIFIAQNKVSGFKSEAGTT